MDSRHDVVRILLVDDHAVVRAGYRRFLETEPDYRVTAEAGSGEEAYAMLQTSQPDVVVLDLSMPGRGGLSTLRRMKLRWPLLPVLVCSMHDNLAFAIQAMRAGANGYMTKSSDPAFMVTAVRKVLAGTSVMSPDMAVKLGSAPGLASEQPTLGLTVREFEIFRMIAAGRSHDEIANLLSVSTKTVANNHSLIKQKLGINTDIELFQLAVGCGAVESS